MVKCRPLIDISMDTLVLTDMWPNVDRLICIDQQHSTACLQNLVDSRPMFNRDVNLVSTNMSIEYRSSVDQGLIEGINPHSTVDAFSTR